MLKFLDKGDNLLFQFLEGSPFEFMIPIITFHMAFPIEVLTYYVAK